MLSCKTDYQATCLLPDELMIQPTGIDCIAGNTHSMAITLNIGGHGLIAILFSITRCFRIVHTRPFTATSDIFFNALDS